MDWAAYLAVLVWHNFPVTGSAVWQAFTYGKLCTSPDQLVDILEGQDRLQACLKSTPAWWKTAEKELRFCENKGVKITYPGAWDYPERFLYLESPPAVLGYFGTPVWRERTCLAVVGSREPSVITQRWMDLHIPRFLGARCSALVSGGARGVDQKAHSLSIMHATPTVCFLPSGLLRPYPHQLREWQEVITTAGGAVVSQFPPLSVMQKGHFHQRNQLIAKIAEVLLVVEANRKSGSQMTARWAIEENVQLGAVPVSPMASSGAANLDLIYDGAHMIRDAWDLVTLFDRSI